MERDAFKKLIDIRDTVTPALWVHTKNKDGCRIDLGVDGFIQVSSERVAEYICLSQEFMHAVTARFNPKNDNLGVDRPTVPAQKEKSP
jgi:hypothetical protein